MSFFGPPNVQKLKIKSDIQRLIKLLKYKKNVTVRQDAVLALGQICDANTVEPIISTLSDADKDVRRAAVEALGNIGDMRAVSSLITVLKEDKNNIVRKAAVQALAQIGDTRAIEPLVVTLNDVDVRDAAEKALLNIDPNWKNSEGTKAAVPQLIAALKITYYKEGHEATIEALAKVGDGKGIEPLFSVMKHDKSVIVRVKAYLALEQIQKGYISETDLKTLIEAIATEIRRLYSQTELIKGGRYVEEEGTSGYWRPDEHTGLYMGRHNPDGFVKGGWVPGKPTKYNYHYTEKHSPDLYGIRTIISILPPNIRERVRAISGEAQSLF